MAQLAERTKRISGSPTMKVTAMVDKLRREGVEVIDFGAGEPDFPTPQPMCEAGIEAVKTGNLCYTPALGL